MIGDVSQIRSLLAASGQSHLSKFWDELSPEEKNKYFEELVSLQLDRINSSYMAAKEMTKNIQLIDGRLMCPDPSICSHADSLRESRPDEYNLYVEKGFRAISERKVAVVLLAGGQGTRLGSSNPKGMYNIGLPSGRSLFQIQAERLLKICNEASEKHGHKVFIPWYIMTSDSTKTETENFFKENNYFGYSRDHVILFEQFNIPVMSTDGKILMKGKSSICWSPDGNGGIYRALTDRGILQNMKTRGIQYVHIYGVDNVLIQMADPVFIGFCIAKSADCAVKVVEKTDPNEPIGVVGKVDGVYRVVEYSEISPSTAALKLPMPPSKPENESRLLYCLGNICNHFMTVGFLGRVCDPKNEVTLPYHAAYKKVAHIDLNSGELVQPTEPNALKMEKFIFDVFKYSERFFIWEVDRAAEFSPLKNGPGAGKDCPETCRKAILDTHAAWAKAAGANFGTEGENIIEISPLVSRNGENLECLQGREIFGINILEMRKNHEGKELPTLITVDQTN